jgi:hypothetical protein
LDHRAKFIYWIKSIIDQINLEVPWCYKTKPLYYTDLKAKMIRYRRAVVKSDSIMNTIIFELIEKLVKFSELMIVGSFETVIIFK